MKKVAVEKKRAAKGLMVAYVITGIALLAVVAYMVFWYNNESLRAVQWNFK